MENGIDWQALLVPSLHLGEVVLRGTPVYLFLFFLLRIFRREAGDIGISDLPVVVLMADAAGNAMSSEYRSFTEGAILVTTIALLDYVVGWLSYRVPGLRRWLRPEGVDVVEDVKECYLEGNGRISVIQWAAK